MLLKMENLKKCPFCGCAGKIWEQRWQRRNLYFVECMVCGAKILPHNDRQQAIDAWNRRV